MSRLGVGRGGETSVVTSWVLHVDLDQFIAAVEVLRRPELRGKPVVVGGDGDPGKRGVVSTASYEARAHGVHSGLPLRTARRLSPDAVFLAVDRAAYEAASAQVMGVLRESGAVVEVMGWDEAFLQVDTPDPEAFARLLAERVRERTQLDCSVGIGENKLQAKLATGFGKPAGVFRLTSANWYEVMGARPTDALWGIGAKTAAKLAALDAEPWVAKSRSKETTFQRDLAEWSQVEAAVADVARQLAAELASERWLVARVVVKIRYVPFFTKTRGVTLGKPGRAAEVVEPGAAAALALFADHRPVRLVGVRAEFARRA
jgi:nucleotidyltransferase/DNA polymerase involved in DNA repair